MIGAAEERMQKLATVWKSTREGAAEERMQES